MADQAEALEWSLVQILTPPTTSWVTLGNTLSFPEPQRWHLDSGYDQSTHRVQGS